MEGTLTRGVWRQWWERSKPFPDFTLQCSAFSLNQWWPCAWREPGPWVGCGSFLRQQRINRDTFSVWPTGVKCVAQWHGVTSPCPLGTYLHAAKATHLQILKVFLILQNISPTAISRSSTKTKLAKKFMAKNRGESLDKTLRFHDSQFLALSRSICGLVNRWEKDDYAVFQTNSVRERFFPREHSKWP